MLFNCHCLRYSAGYRLGSSRHHKHSNSAITQKKLAIFSFPILIIWVIIVMIEIRLLTILFDEQFRENSLRFSAKIYFLFCIIFIVSYYSNLHSFYIVVTTLLAMLPQIYKNYMVGHKLKQNMKYFLCYILPRYAFIVYHYLFSHTCGCTSSTSSD